MYFNKTSYINSGINFFFYKKSALETKIFVCVCLHSLKIQRIALVLSFKILNTRQKYCREKFEGSKP